jgi:hypothetical protein
MIHDHESVSLILPAARKPAVKVPVQVTKTPAGRAAETVGGGGSK